MMIKIPLQVEGVDLSSDTVLANMDSELDELDWVTHGPLTLAIVYCDASHPKAAVAEAQDWVLRIHKLQPEARVSRVFDELAGWSEIAARCAVTPEAVRTWAKGLRRGQAHPFPAVRQAVPLGAGRRSLHLYAWRETLTWVRDVIGLDPDDGIAYLDDSGIAELDAYIASERGATLPNDYTPLPSQPSFGPVETKLPSSVATWTQPIEGAHEHSHLLAQLSLAAIVADQGMTPHRTQSEANEFTIEGADHHWPAERSATLA
jgi:hypothetical protein